MVKGQSGLIMWQAFLRIRNLPTLNKPERECQYFPVKALTKNDKYTNLPQDDWI